MCSGNDVKINKSLVDFLHSEEERPIVCQLFGSKPHQFYQAAQLVKQYNFDGIDINMGCPDKNVLKQGSGAALIKAPQVARDIIRACKEGGGGLPVSVKTRTGFVNNTASEWIQTILDERPDAITLHGRTMKEMSRCAAHWDVIGDVAAQVRASEGHDTVLIGNGDVETYGDALGKVETYGVDGVMIGRGMFGAPWIFKDLDHTDITLEMKVEALMEHTSLFQELMFEPGHRPISVLKRMFKSYVVGLPNAKILRCALDSARTPSEIQEVCARYLEETAEED